MQGPTAMQLLHSFALIATATTGGLISTKMGFACSEMADSTVRMTSSHTTEWSSRYRGQSLPSVNEEFRSNTPCSTQPNNVSRGLLDADFFVSLYFMDTSTYSEAMGYQHAAEWHAPAIQHLFSSHAHAASEDQLHSLAAQCTRFNY
jgi:hypothetical protein